MRTNNVDTGTLFVGNDLPTKLQKRGVPEIPLFVQIAGESAARKVSYVMGSAKKGYFLALKGTGIVPVGTVDYELIHD